MNYRKFYPKIGDVVTVSEVMSLRFEKIADDISPAWIEVPLCQPNTSVPLGTYIPVTVDVWFVFDLGGWRVMPKGERVQAERQGNLGLSV